MSWQAFEVSAAVALDDAGFRGRGGYEVRELATILERDLELEELQDHGYPLEAAERVRYLTRVYILTQW